MSLLSIAKNVIFMGLFVFICASCSALEFNIREVEALLINSSVEVPKIIQYYQNGKHVPSCKIVNKSGKELDLISFDEGDYLDYSNCSKVSKPQIFISDMGYLAVYKYLEEETRGSFIDNYVVLKLNDDGFCECKNNVALSKGIKSKGFIASIKKYGCK